MSKRTLFLISVLFIITIVLLLIALYQPQAPKTLPTANLPKEPIAQTILSFGSPLIATSSSTTVLNYSLPININSFKNKVTAVQLEMQYDPQILSNVSIVPGSFFTKPEVLLNQIDSKTGRISYAFGTGLTEPGVVGKGIAANLTFSAKTKAIQQTAIIFLPKTLVAAQGINQTVLKTTANALFTTGIIPTIIPSIDPSTTPSAATR